MKFQRNIAVAVCAMATVGAGQFSTGNSSTTNSTKPAIFPLSTDDYMSSTFLEYLAMAAGGGSAPGEVLRMAAQVTPGDFESWYENWKFLADSIHEQGVAAASKGFKVSARDAYFRSASYFRAADFYLKGNATDARLKQLWDAQQADFHKAIKLLPIPGQNITIKADGFDVPAYFFPGGRDSIRRTTVILGTGYDAPMEELYHGIGVQILARGYNLLAFEGPGQPTVVHTQGKGFIKEWEKVVTPVVDYALTRDDVAADKIAYLTMSFGGILGPLAASKEHRLAALIVIEGLVDLAKRILEGLPATLQQAYAAGNQTLFDGAMVQVLKSPKAPTQLIWLVEQGLYTFTTRSPYQWLKKMDEFRITEQVLSNITCPIFVGKGENDLIVGTQADQFQNMTNGKGFFYEWKTNLGAGQHCQTGAEQQFGMVTMDWLAGVLGEKNCITQQ